MKVSHHKVLHYKKKCLLANYMCNKTNLCMYLKRKSCMLFILPPLPVCDMGLLTCFWLYTSVDGYFENWGAWSTCSQTCNHGVKTRSRVCVPPNHGGQPCSGSRNEIALCIKSHCPGIFIVTPYFKFSQF